MPAACSMLFRLKSTRTALRPELRASRGTLRTARQTHRLPWAPRPCVTRRERRMSSRPSRPLGPPFLRVRLSARSMRGPSSLDALSWERPRTPRLSANGRLAWAKSRARFRQEPHDGRRPSNSRAHVSRAFPRRPATHSMTRGRVGPHPGPRSMRATRRVAPTLLVHRRRRCQLTISLPPPTGRQTPRASTGS